MKYEQPKMGGGRPGWMMEVGVWGVSRGSTGLPLVTLDSARSTLAQSWGKYQRYYGRGIQALTLGEYQH